MPEFTDAARLRPLLENQLDIFTDLSRRYCDTLQQLSKLNLRLAEQLAAGTVAACSDVVHCSDPLQLVPTALRHAAPLGQHLQLYQQGLLSLLGGAQAGVAGAMREQAAEAGRGVAAMAPDFAWQNAGEDEQRPHH